MLPNVTIRPERPSDVEAISRVTELAFRSHPHGHQTESLIIDGLRRCGALSISLVAELDGQVIGYIAFSPVDISDASRDWYPLDPVSVTPAYQGQGIGQALVKAELAALSAIELGDASRTQKMTSRSVVVSKKPDSAWRIIVNEP